jgi:ABC-type lipoprotein release transport system permease subunit
MQATCSAREQRGGSSLRGVTVLGVNRSFFDPAAPPARFGETGPAGRSLAWLSRPVAEALGVSEGDVVTLHVQEPGDVPRESSLGKKDVALVDWQLTVAAVLDDSTPGAAFSLRPSLAAPRNILVALPELQARLAAPGQANVLLAAGPKDALNKALQDNLSLEDWGLVLRTPMSRARDLVRRYDTIVRDGRLSYSEWVLTRQKGKDRPRYAWVIEEGLRPGSHGVKVAKGDKVDLPSAPFPESKRVRTVMDFREYYERLHPYVALESKNLLLSRRVADAALEAAKIAELRVAPTLVYLCRIQVGQKRIAGVVAALEPGLAPPLGPFLPPGQQKLGEHGIVLLDYGWEEAKRPPRGDRVTLIFKPPETHGPAPDQRTEFRLAGYLPAKGVAADPGLTPDFPGITDREDLGAWDLPFDDPDWQKNIGKEYGDLYWKQYRATPKAYINLKRGKELWASRFGELTSIRLAPIKPSSPEDAGALEHAAERFREALRQQLRLYPSDGGFVFESVRAEGLEASEGGTKLFGLLFLGFSFFLILSALLLVGLLLRLNIDRRAPEVGLLFAEGFPKGKVRRLYLEEGMLLALVGTLLGLLAALWYSRALVGFLAWLWPGGALRSLLAPHATPLSLALGALGMLVVSFATIAWVVRALGRVPPRALLAGQTTGEGDPEARPVSSWLRRVLIGALVLGAILLAAGFFVPGHEAQAGTFFSSGMLFLTAGLLAMRAWMQSERHSVVEGPGLWSITRLGVRNAARHSARSLLAMGLLAAAAFLIVAVESFRRRAEAGTGDIHASDGGFALLAETDLPVFRDLNTDAGRQELRRRLLQNGMDEQEANRAESLLKDTTIIAFRARAGDDASCLNLYQPRSPRVLGVPEKLIARGGFVFDALLSPTPQEKDNPWLALERTEGIPAFGEANTVTWMLKSGLGKQVTVPDETGTLTELAIVGLLHDSVFQSSLLVSEKNFLRLYPTHEGYTYFLIAPPRGKEAEVKRVLERALSGCGVEVTPTRERLAEYLAVENTYLTTFQALGGLGLLLGSLGLAVVLLRAVWERRGELALLRALGYQRSVLAYLVLAENSFLLLAGLAVGSVSALLSILPQLVSGQGSVPWLHLILLFAGVLVVALGAGALATAAALRAPIVPALRRE